MELAVHPGLIEDGDPTVAAVGQQEVGGAGRGPRQSSDELVDAQGRDDPDDGAGLAERPEHIGRPRHRLHTGGPYDTGLEATVETR
jgi:hypothetical protein